ncbi:DGQHR domain-containing protein [Flavobacterium koreense]
MNNIETVKGFVVNQLTSKPIAIAAINFKILRNIVKFTSREPQQYDPFNPEKSVNKITEEVNKDYYQRLRNDKRISNIYSFLLKEINNIHNSNSNAIGSFPTAIIISMDINQEAETKEEYLKNTLNIKNDEYIGGFYNRLDGNNLELLIPQKKVSLIVDGQHRLSGMIKLYEDAVSHNIKIGRKSLIEEYPNLSYEKVINSLDQFDLNCTILLGFDKWEQGKVFADVNFNQKPVNKSLYYDIFGSFPDPNKNDIFLAHMLTMHLNNNDKSVIKGFIKMLGSGKGYFSQAFFVEAILEHFTKKGIWGNIPMDFLNNGDEHKILSKFFRAYFAAIKDVFNPYWPTLEEDTSRKYPHILVKTTGMGALIKLINPIYRKLKLETDFKTIEEDALLELLKKELVKAKEKGKVFFSKEGEYAGSGSLGLQSQLYNELGKALGYFK